MRGSLAIVLALAAGSCFAQKGVGAPPDVPKNHWAYEAVDQMFKLGILVGYPNGTFNGSRPVSRYELAVALDKLDQALENLKPTVPAQTKTVDLGSVKAQLDALDKELAALKPMGDDLASLKATMGQLQGHLSDVKADAKGLKDGIDKAKG